MKIECILLIDDDEPTNFINHRIIKHSGIESNVQICESGSEALDYLTVENGKPLPGIILLDINMPGMNGWEFLDEYEKISADKRSQTFLAMLSTSLNPDDIEKAEQRSSVNVFLSKPLTTEHINLLVEKYQQL